MSERQTPENDAPVRACCGQRHHGPVCPDGLVMCCICFKRVGRDRLHMLEDGNGLEVSSAPIYEDVCRTCKQREERWGQMDQMRTIQAEYERAEREDDDFRSENLRTIPPEVTP